MKPGSVVILGRSKTIAAQFLRVEEWINALPAAEREGAVLGAVAWLDDVAEEALRLERRLRAAIDAVAKSAALNVPVLLLYDKPTVGTSSRAELLNLLQGELQQVRESRAAFRSASREFHTAARASRGER